MKMFRLLCILLATMPAVGQIYSGSPAIYPTGQPLANTPMAICNANPQRTTPPCLSTLAQTYSDETLTTACTVQPSPTATPGPISGLNCTNPGIAGQLGNWTVYLATSQNYWAQFYPKGLQPTIVPFTIGGSGGGGGGGNFPGKSWTYVDPVLTAGASAVLNLQAASSATGFQIPFGNPNTFVSPTQPAGVAVDQISNQINFNDGSANHYLANIDSLSTAPTTNGLIVQSVNTGAPPSLSTVNIVGNTNDIVITNPDGTAGNPTIASATTGVTAGSYTCATITINAFGKITAASSTTCTSGSGNTTSTALVTGNAPTASGTNSIIDSGVGLSGGVETFNGSTSGTITLTPNSTATTLTLGGSGAVSLLTPTGSASNVVLGTAANTGINFVSNLLNYSQSGTNVFSWGVNSAKCNGTCNWSGSIFTNAQTFQSGIDTTTPGSTGGAATFRSANITGGGTTASSTGAALFGSGNNAATGGSVQTVGDATFTAGGFTGASGAATGWSQGHTILGQYYWADTVATTNTLGCITTPGTNGQMPKLGTCTVTSNVPWKGAIQAASGQSVFVVKSGHATLLSATSQTDTAGYFVCIDGSNAGNVIVQSTSCTSGQTVGTIDKTGSGGTSHSVDISGVPQEIISGGGNTNTSGAVVGDLPVFTGSTTLGDSGFSQSGGTLGLGSNGGNAGVLKLNGSTSGNFTITPSATSNTATLGGSGFTSLVTPTGTSSAVSVGTGANTGIYFASNGLNYAFGGTQVFSAQVNQMQCNGSCAWSGNVQTQNQTFQSGLDASTTGSIGGNAIFKSSSVTGGASTGSGSGNATFQSGDNAATGGLSQTIGDAVLTSGGFTGASGATTSWTAGHAGVHQKYWADATTTTGTLACYTTAGTNGQQPKVGTCSASSANVPWIGVIANKTGQSVEVVKLGHASGVLSATSQTDTAGYFVCLDTNNAGDVIVQSTSCTSGQKVGVIDQTGSGGTSHSVDINPFPEEVGGGGGGGSVTNSNTLTLGTAIYGNGTSIITSVTTELAVDQFAGADFGTQANNAIAALPSTGGTIRFSCKNYSASSTTITVNKSNVTLQGCGSQDASVSSTGGTTLNFASGVSGINVTSSFAQIKDLMVVSASTGSGSDNGISLSNGKPILWNVGIRHFGGVGIIFNNNTDRWNMTNVESSANFGDGFQWTAVSDDNIGLGQNLSAVSNGGYGYDMKGGGGNVFVETHASLNTSGAWFVHAVDNYFYGTYVETGTGSSFTFDTGITLNTVVFNSFGLPTTYTDNGTNVRIVNGLNDALSLARSLAANSVSGTDTITITTSPTFSKQTQPGLSITFVPTGPNATTSVTAAINGLTALPVEKSSPTGLVALAVGDLTNTQVANISLDPTNSFWVLDNPATASFVGGVPGVLGDMLFSSGSNTLDVDSGNAYYDFNHKILNVPGLNLNSSLPGFTSWVTGSGSIPIAANSQGLSVPSTVTKSAVWLFPQAPSNGVMNYTSESDGVVSANYSSGGTITGSTGQTCNLASFNNGCTSTTASVALTSSNTIAGGTAISMVGAGNSCSSAPTSATLSSGTATCSGTATLSSGVLGGVETSSILPVATTSTANALVETNSNGLIDLSFTQSPSIMKLEDNLCGGTTTTGNIGQLGWSFSNIGSAPTVTGISGTYPYLCQLKFLTASGATQGQGGSLNISTAAANQTWADFGDNTNWSTTYIFQLGSTTSDIFYAGLGALATTMRQNNGILIRHDTNSPGSSAAITSVVCTTTQCTVTLTSVTPLLVGQTWTISGETCPTRNVNVANVAVSITGNAYKFNAAGAAETCTVQGTDTSTAEADFMFETIAGSTALATVTDSGVAADTSWHKITIASTVAGTVTFTLDSHSPVSISTNVPTNSLMPLVIIGTDVTAQKFVLLDYFKFGMTGLSR